MLTTLSKTNEGIYVGQLNATEGWMNFHVVDEEHNIWYGTAPTDKTALSSAEGHWNFWIDSEQTGIYDIEVNLNTMKWTHTYNVEATASIRFTEVDSDKTSVWYNLQGHRLSTAKNGVLIKSQASGYDKQHGTHTQTPVPSMTRGVPAPLSFFRSLDRFFKKNWLISKIMATFAADLLKGHRICIASIVEKKSLMIQSFVIIVGNHRTIEMLVQKVFLTRKQ